MVLDPTALASDLAAVFASYPATPKDSADGLAAAYYSYAQSATFATSIPAIIPAKRDAMAATLQAAIANPLVGLPATFAGAFAASVALFWAAVPVATVPSGIPAGATNGCPGAGGLTASLSLVFANPLNTAVTCAAGMAAALQIATLTTTATVAPPTGTIVPIT